MKKLIGLLAISIAVSGCANRIGDFTVATTKNMDINGSLHKVDYDARLIGKDMAHIILTIPTGTPNMKEAMDNAIEKSPGAVGLSNVTIKQVGWTALIYGQIYYEIEGNPIYEARSK